jgi:glycosyltransferase involved in cell wall biosynthesis
MPTVSVVIPTYRRPPLLRRAVASVLAQTVDDFEIVVVDDASDESTRGVVRSFGDRRIKYMRHQANLGVASARNTGILNSAGRFIAFLDDDDEWLPEKLELQVDRMESVEGSVGAICCGHVEVDSSSHRIVAEMRPRLKGRVFEALLAQGSFNHTSTMLVRAECFRRVGLFDPALRYGEDLDMWLRLAREYEFDFVDRPLVRLYFQPSGLTQDYSAIVSGAEIHLQKYREFFESHPSIHGRRLHRLGTFYCLLGDVRRGREAFRQALGVDPTLLKSYVGLGLSLAGPRSFKACFAAKDWLLSGTAGVHVKGRARP